MPQAAFTVSSCELQRDGKRRAGQMPDKPVHVYVLRDPSTLQVKYVGVTCQKPRARLAVHVSAARYREKSPVRSWIKGLLKQNQRPLMEVIETVPQGGDWQEAERAWIARYRSDGVQLKNITEGGDGARGVVVTPEARAALSRALKGRKHTPEARANMATASKIRGIPKETREKAHVACRRETRSPETEAKMKALRNGLGHRCSEEVKAKMSAARKAAVAKMVPQTGANNPNSRAVIIDGVTYPTVRAAALHFNVVPTAIIYRIRRGCGSYADGNNPPVKPPGRIGRPPKSGRINS